jgi:hypothetical protein
MIKYNCEFCSKSFKKEISLINHNCEKKRRWFSKDEPVSRMAFIAWSRFYELSQYQKGVNVKSEFKEFINSKFYIGFNKFAHYMIDINVINPTNFIDFVIKSNTPLKTWSTDIMYQQYIIEYIKKESAEKALERMIPLMRQWSEIYNTPWTDFFRKISPNLAISWISSGRISPWILYNSDSALELFHKCNPEQLNIITKVAPIDQWKIRFSKNLDSVLFIRQTLEQAGI